MVVHVFMSHTKLDKDFCDRFDVAVARVGIRAFRSEFETIKPPAWKTIKDQMGLSSAMFLLVGKELIKSQTASDQSVEARAEWKHTQNWIAYEVGLACQRGIDVWVIGDDVKINFPVPYLNNYALYGLGRKKNRKIPFDEIEFIKDVLENYSKDRFHPLGFLGRNITCSNTSCGSEFNLHSVVQKEKSVVCPTCLKAIEFPEGWLLKKKTK